MPGPADDMAERESATRPGGRGAGRVVLLAAACGFVYLLIAGGFRFDFRQTEYAHHVLMADALLHGQFQIRPEALEWKRRQVTDEVVRTWEADLRRRGYEVRPALREEMYARTYAQAPRNLDSDWAILPDGRYYGYWAPLTPAVLVPFVAIFGLGVSDTAVNAVFGGLNIGLFYWLLRRADRAGLCPTTEPARVALSLLLAFGTSHFWLTCRAQVWFAVHIVTMTAVLASLLAVCGPAAHRRHWLAAGILFGAALLGRNIAVLLGLFFVVLMWSRLRKNGRLRELALRLALFGPPVAAAVGVQLAYNHARFGDPLESGLKRQVQSGGLARFRERFERHGTFSPHYVPHNLYHYLVNPRLPRLDDGRLWFDPEGNSLFLVTPPMVYLLLAWRRRTGFIAALLAGVLPLIGALQFYFASGFVQFGPRYLSDAMPLLLMLVAVGMRGRLDRLSYALVVLAIAAHLFGTYRLCDVAFAPLAPYATALNLVLLTALALLIGLAAQRPGTARRAADLGK